MTSPTTSASAADRWLDRWLPLVGERAGGVPILELGCGAGRDTEVLAAAGCRVVGVDLSGSAIARARERVAAAEFHCQDIRAPWPVERAGVVLASLALHYFPWDETAVLVDRIHRALRPNGLLLCRLNSTNDHYYGASGHPTIAENFHLVDGGPKRFFDRAAIDRLFARGWHSLHKKEGVIARYDHPKSVWEVILERR